MFFLAALLLKSPQEAPPPAVSGAEPASASQPPAPAEPLAPPQGDPAEPKPEAEPNSAEQIGDEDSTESLREDAGDSTSVEEGSDPTEREAEQEESPPPGNTLGSLSKNAIDDGVRDQMPEILECYQGWLSRNPELEGTIQVKFVIATSEDDPELGYVRSVDIAETTMGNVWMEGCVLSAMEDAEFEAPSSGIVIVRYPFEFSSD